MNKQLYFLILLLFVMVMNACAPQKQPVDLIVYHAQVYTVDSAFSKASAMAVNNGQFVAVGTDEDILNKYKSEHMMNAEGKFVYPGFNDGHSHFMGYGIWLTQYANLVGLRSFDAMLEVLKKFHEENPDEWILGRGWDQNLWENKEFPTNDKLDVLFPNVPVVLTRIDGHAVLANSAALKVAGVDEKTVISGGEILKSDGKLTGMLLDNAADKMKACVPELSENQKIRALMLAQEKCLAQGLTTVSDAGLEKEDILLIDSLQRAGKLKIKVYAMLSPTSENLEYFLPKGPLHQPGLTVSSVKLYADGALGSRGALMIEPYADDPNNFGLQMESNDYYDSICQLAYDNGFQVNTHAIGDGANRLVLDIYGRILKGTNDRRWRIEHAQVVHPDDMNKFGQYSIIPSIQSTHCTSDMDWADERLGADRIKTAYAYHELLKQNGWLVNGTDFPIEDISPLFTFYSSVSRKHQNGEPAVGFQMENALSRKETLYSITLWPAMGSFDEKQKGSIEAGKQADFVMLDADIMQVPENELYKVKVLETWVDGERVY